MDKKTYRHWDRRRMWTLAGWLAVVLGASGPWVAEAAEPLGPWPPAQMALAGARVAWLVDLPMGYTTSIKSYHLVDGYLYGLGTDGFVRAIRADTGEYVWTQKLGEPFDTIWPPIAARLEVVSTDAELSPTKLGENEDKASEKAEKVVEQMVDTVVFTLLRSAVFLDPKTGRQLKEVQLRSSSNSAVAVSPEYYFDARHDRQLWCVSLTDGLKKWHVGTRMPVDLAPVYVASESMVVVADSQGTVGGVTIDKNMPFTQSLGAKPIGWLAVDELAVYAATADKMLHAVDRAGNRILWQYRLGDIPAGGPVVTAKNVYQATVGGGLFCIRKGERHSWHNARALRFLAEWPSRIAVLYPNGQIALLHPDTGEAAELVNPESAAEGVSNPWNDAVILASPKGRLCCIRPIGAKSLTLADFRSAPPVAEAPAAVGESTDENNTEAAGAEPAVTPTAPISTEEVLLTDPLRSKRKIVH